MSTELQAWCLAHSKVSWPGDLRGFSSFIPQWLQSWYAWPKNPSKRMVGHSLSSFLIRLKSEVSAPTFGDHALPHLWTTPNSQSREMMVLNSFPSLCKAVSLWLSTCSPKFHEGVSGAWAKGETEGRQSCQGPARAGPRTWVKAGQAGEAGGWIWHLADDFLFFFRDKPKTHQQILEFQKCS